uniref:Uncharacterized protein n=1 Tax=Trichogramma kaykai TaxID=54128 RepID=A0ABD2XNS1_9HYME
MKVQECFLPKKNQGIVTEINHTVLLAAHHLFLVCHKYHSRIHTDNTCIGAREKECRSAQIRPIVLYYCNASGADRVYFSSFSRVILANLLSFDARSVVLYIDIYYKDTKITLCQRRRIAVRGK